MEVIYEHKSNSTNTEKELRNTETKLKTHMLMLE